MRGMGSRLEIVLVKRVTDAESHEAHKSQLVHSPGLLPSFITNRKEIHITWESGLLRLTRKTPSIFFFY